MGFKKYLGNKHDLLINSLIDLFKKFGLDWTVFFRKLSLINFDPNKISKKANLKIIASSSYQKTDEGFEHKVNEWLCNYIYQIKSEELSSEERIELMDATNPDIRSSELSPSRSDRKSPKRRLFVDTPTNASNAKSLHRPRSVVRAI